jgi:hypothetical protein
MMDVEWAAFVQSLAHANSTDSPLLPTLASQQMWMRAAWALVLAWVVARLLRRLNAGPWALWSAWGTLAVWLYLPGAYSPSYWLGLAFQAPSLTTVGLCGAALLNMAGKPVQQVAHRRRHLDHFGAEVFVLVIMGIAAGWLLLLDTFALLPGVQLYAWGFSPAAPAMLFLLALLPWAASGNLGRSLKVSVALALAVAVVFMAVHLPSGNVWDAVLDPWLWVTLHVWAWRWVRRH